MYRFKNGWRLAACALAIVLGGCSANDAAGPLSATAVAPTSVAAGAPSATMPAAEQATAIPEATAAPAAERATLVPATATPAAQVQPVSQPADAALQDARSQIAAEEQIVADVFARVGPSVVRIETSQGLGSGWLIDADGHIITNNHVIADSQNGRVNVAFSGLFETVGQVVGADPDSDIAVVKVEELPQDVRPVEVGDSDAVRVGQRTIAIGNPLGQDRTVTTGIVSAIGRTIEEDPRYNYSIGGAIQTDAAINPGNSGGPLLNTLGQVIGMNTAILSQSGTSSGIGFSVPINLIKKVSQALIQNGKYEHPYLGVALGDVTTLDARQNNLPSAGVLIQPTDNSGPVAQAGLSGQAILVSINNEPVTSSDEVIAYLELRTRPGDTITLSIVGSNGETRDLSVQLAARPNVADRQQP